MGFFRSRICCRRPCVTAVTRIKNDGLDRASSDHLRPKLWPDDSARSTRETRNSAVALTTGTRTNCAVNDRPAIQQHHHGVFRCRSGESFRWSDIGREAVELRDVFNAQVIAVTDFDYLPVGGRTKRRRVETGQIQSKRNMVFSMGASRQLWFDGFSARCYVNH